MSNVSKIGGKVFAFAIVAMMIAAAFVVLAPMEKSVSVSAQTTNDDPIVLEADKPMTVGGLTWDGAGNILMNNFNMVTTTNQTYFDAIRVEYDQGVDIELVGSNSITVNVTMGIGNLNCIYICGDSPLTIHGSGSLDIQVINGGGSINYWSTVYTIWAEYDVTIDGVEIKVTVDDFASNNSARIRCIQSYYGYLTITNNAKVEITTGDLLGSGDSVYGLYADEEDIIIKDSEVSVKMGKAESSYAMYSEGVNISKSDVRASAYTAAIDCDNVKVDSKESIFGGNDVTKDPTDNISAKKLTEYKSIWCKYEHNELASNSFILLGIAFVILVIVAGIYIRKDHH